MFTRSQIVDGIVSPAHGAHYAPGGGIWTIVVLNEQAKLHAPAEYAAYLDCGVQFIILSHQF